MEQIMTSEGERRGPAASPGLDVDSVVTAMVAVVSEVARIDDDRELGRGVRAIVRALSADAADRATGEDPHNVVDLQAAALAMARRKQHRDSSG